MEQGDPEVDPAVNPGILHFSDSLLSESAGYTGWVAYSFYRVWDDNTNLKNEKEIVLTNY